MSSEDNPDCESSDENEQIKMLQKQIEELKTKKNLRKDKKRLQNGSDVNVNGVSTTTDCKTTAGNTNKTLPTFVATADENGKKLVEEKRGLVVICCHKEFHLTIKNSTDDKGETSKDKGEASEDKGEASKDKGEASEDKGEASEEKTHILDPRPAADIDMEKMVGRWCQFGCEILQFSDKGNTFYQNELVNEINTKLRLLPQLEFFTLILSTHGEEKEEAINGEKYFQHYFYSKDGQIQTQTLIDSIVKIEFLVNKIKLFVIQACRSRNYPSTESDNNDLGAEVFICEEKSMTTYPCIDRTTLHDTTRNVLNQKNNMQHTESKVITAIDAKGKEDNSEAALQSSIQIKDTIVEYTPTSWIPHCDNCIIMFGSMTGKYAFCVKNQLYHGSWLIDALDEALSKNDLNNDNVDILHVLTETNNKVAQKEANYKTFKCIKAQSCFFHNITEELFLVRN